MQTRKIKSTIIRKILKIEKKRKLKIQKIQKKPQEDNHFTYYTTDAVTDNKISH